jgi:hypothetical protein
MAKVIFQHSNHSEETVAEFSTFEEAKAFVEMCFTDDPEEVDKALFPEGAEVIVMDDERMEMFTNQWEPVKSFSIE